MTHACTTRDNAFAGYHIPNGADLVSATWYQLLDRGYEAFEPTETFADELGKAFRTAFVRTAPVPIVPEPVDEAVVDATTITAYEYSHRSEADLRTVVLPEFYQTVADLYCDYRTAYPDSGVDIRFDADTE